MKRLSIFSCVAALALVSASALAGAKWTYPVSIQKDATGAGSMVGTLGSIRNSADTVTHLGCYYEHFPSTWRNYPYASCFGYDGTQWLSCYTTDPALTETIARLQGDSYLWIAVKADGTCDRVQIGTHSWGAPKAP